MPGIVGLISKMPKGASEKSLNVMLRCMLHESFYTSGTYVNEALGFYCGWACHKGSFSDCMPVFNEAQDLVLIFSGTHYGDSELRNRLIQKGHGCTGYDASYLIHLYEEDEQQFFELLNGWFVGVLIDLRNRRIVLFNDRYGLGRLYYHEDGEAFYFASEAKSLLKLLPELRRIDMKSLAEFFSCDCPLEGRTFFEGISLLPGGSVWSFNGDKTPKKDSYFRPRNWEGQDRMDPKSFYEVFATTFQRLLPRYFPPKERNAMSLTGGLDSRMIMACLDLPPGELPCYTFGGMGRDTYDVRIGRQVAQACEQPYTLIKLNGDFLSQFPFYAERTVYLSEGCHEAFGAHDLFFNKVAREIAPGRMSGKFGSEVVRLSRHLKASVPSPDLFDTSFNRYIEGAAKTLEGVSSGSKVSFAAFKEIPWREYGRLAIEQSQLTFGTPYMDNDLVKIMYYGESTLSDMDEIPLRMISEHKPALLEILTDHGFRSPVPSRFSRYSKLFHWNVLFKADYLFNYVPSEYAGLVRLLEPLAVDRLFLGRHVLANYRKWVCGELADYIREILLDSRALSRPYLNKRSVERLVLQQTNGQPSQVLQLSKILTVELLHRLLVEDI
jgi:asparagine synthase (glutamine-hydrolysing)